MAARPLPARRTMTVRMVSPEDHRTRHFTGAAQRLTSRRCAASGYVDCMAADGPVGTVEEIHTALRDAVDAALHAPSILNTQPWSWHLRASILELRRDTSRQLPSIDAQGRLATLSCGAALHHASVFLSAHGHRVTIQRLPDAGSPSILARLRIAGEAE